MIDALTRARGRGEQKDLDAAARATGNHQIVGHRFRRQNLREMIDAHAARATMLRRDDRILILPGGAALVPGPVAAALEGIALSEQGAQEVAGICHDGRIDVRLELRVFGGTILCAPRASLSGAYPVIAKSRRTPIASKTSQFCRAKFAPRAARVPGRPTKSGFSLDTKSEAHQVAATGMPSSAAISAEVA